MPTRPGKQCATPGCTVLTPERLCPRHRAEQRARVEAERPSAVDRGYGADWQRQRRRILTRDPFCRWEEAPCDQLSTDVAHIVPRPQHLGPALHPVFDGDENLRGLCHRHHSVETARRDTPAWRARRTGGG